MISTKLDSLLLRYRNKPEVSELKLLVSNSNDGFSYSWQSPESKPTHLIASSTKMMAATVVQQLADEGKLQFADPITKYLPESDSSGLHVFGGQDLTNQVTVRAVVSHTSGIADYYQTKRLPKNGDLETISRDDPGWSFEEALDVARALPAKFPPHSGKAHYSATNYQLVGRIIEQVSGSSLESELQRRIFDPLGMSQSCLLTMNNLSEFEKASQVLLGNQKYAGAKRIASLGAEGAVISSLEDTAKFMQSFFSGDLLSPTSRDNLLDNWLPIFPRINYASGVMSLNLPRFITKASHAKGLLGHSGATGHVMFYDPIEKLTIVATINQLSPSTLPYRLMAAVLRILNSR